MDDKKGETPKTAVQTKEDALSSSIIYGLEGKNNIIDLDSCTTRLRTTVADGSLVDIDLPKSIVAAGVVHKGSGAQIIFGPKVSVIKSNLEEFLESDKADQMLTKEDYYTQTKQETTPAEEIPGCKTNRRK